MVVCVYAGCVYVLVVCVCVCCIAYLVKLSGWVEKVGRTVIYDGV